MTCYTVVWLNEAIDELGEVWIAAGDRKAVTAASAKIDIELANDAATKGRPLSEGLLVFDSPPLRAVYWINDVDLKVEILRVRSLQQLA